MASVKTTRAHYTCGCVIDYDWFDGPEERVHHNHRTIKSCAAHAHIKKCSQRDAAAVEWCKQNQLLVLNRKGERQ